MFGLGWSEILLCAIVFVLVVPAGQWPEYGIKLGRWLRDIRKMLDGITSDLTAPFQEMRQELDFTAHNAQIMARHPGSALPPHDPVVHHEFPPAPDAPAPLPLDKPPAGAVPPLP